MPGDNIRIEPSHHAGFLDHDEDPAIHWYSVSFQVRGKCDADRLTLEVQDLATISGRWEGSPNHFFNDGVEFLRGHLTTDEEIKLIRDRVLMKLARWGLGPFEDFRQSGILGPDGEQLSEPQSKRIISDVSRVNTLLLERLYREPKLLYDISSRSFEELVAEILIRLGWDVELTRPWRDGGFDMFAAKKNSLGTLLYLVECKRYTPPNKVGVEVVRSLHGVVQSKQATAGAVVTTSFFTAGAQEFQKENKFKLALHDYCRLRQWIDDVQIVQ
jgi:hypothetical protein